METDKFRVWSSERLSRAGLRISPTLPVIDEFSPRSTVEIVDRILCLNAVAAAAHGFDKGKALSWLEQENVSENLTVSEGEFLTSGQDNANAFKIQVEGIWALAWIIGIVPNLDFWQTCDSQFVRMLPDLKTSESSAEIRARAETRDDTEIGFAVDLAYCLHWLLRENAINEKPPPKGLLPFILEERRRALEWAIGEMGWDEVSLDT